MNNDQINQIKKPISKRLFKALTAPLRTYFSPKFIGIENLCEDTPTLFVGNHSIYGLIDVPLLMTELYCQNNMFIHGLADHLHFKIPGWRNLLSAFGAVEGTRENCSAMMSKGKHILVFPGGGREVCKRKGEAYQLVWKQRAGFAKLAIENGYQIIPFASVGADDCYDILFDANDIAHTKLGSLILKTRLGSSFFRNGDMIPPLSKGLGLTVLPRPEPFYFSFGKPIKTQELLSTKETVWDTRERTRLAVFQEIQELIKIREKDESTSLIRSLLRAI